MLHHQVRYTFHQISNTHLDISDDLTYSHHRLSFQKGPIQARTNTPTQCLPLRPRHHPEQPHGQPTNLRLLQQLLERQRYCRRELRPPRSNGPSGSQGFTLRKPTHHFQGTRPARNTVAGHMGGIPNRGIQRQCRSRRHQSGARVRWCCYCQRDRREWTVEWFHE